MYINGKEVNPTVENPPALAPAGSLRSSASDMAKLYIGRKTKRQISIC
ncbi:MAG TPA: hypothetical protein VFD60_00045 [Nitrososphaeraceae archaeon]|jgi:hypothetical protein|nr:hypothetical protein [Nitrososphaeraceae archaeon]